MVAAPALSQRNYILCFHVGTLLGTPSISPRSRKFHRKIGHLVVHDVVISPAELFDQTPDHEAEDPELNSFALSGNKLININK
jgi:hypothetical protein